MVRLTELHLGKNRVRHHIILTGGTITAAGLAIFHLEVAAIVLSASLNFIWIWE